MAPKRRLHLLPSVQSTETPDTPSRPGWQWSLFCAALLLVAWALFALVAASIGAKVTEHSLARGAAGEAGVPPEALARLAVVTVLLHLTALGGAAFSAGFVTGRWGPGRGLSESGSAGVIVGGVALIVAVLTGTTGEALTALAVIVPWASGFAVLGARLGSRKKGVLPAP